MSNGNPPQQSAGEKAKGQGFRARSQSGDSVTHSKLFHVNPEPEQGKGAVFKIGDDYEDGVVGVGHAQANGYVDANTHRTIKGARSPSIRRSRSFDDVLNTRDSPDRQVSPVDAEFCMLSYTEPDDVETGGDYTMIFDECEYLSDEEGEEHSTEVKDLTPQGAGEETGNCRQSCSMTPPRATTVLINAFLQRIESVMVNGVHYPPGLFFVQ